MWLASDLPLTSILTRALQNNSQFNTNCSWVKANCLWVLVDTCREIFDYSRASVKLELGGTVVWIMHKPFCVLCILPVTESDNCTSFWSFITLLVCLTSCTHRWRLHSFSGVLSSTLWVPFSKDGQFKKSHVIIYHESNYHDNWYYYDIIIKYGST